MYSLLYSVCAFMRISFMLDFSNILFLKLSDSSLFLCELSSNSMAYSGFSLLSHIRKSMCFCAIFPNQDM